MAQHRQRYEEREQTKWVNGRDIITTDITSHTTPDGSPIIDDSMNYSGYNYLPRPYS